MRNSNISLSFFLLSVIFTSRRLFPGTIIEVNCYTIWLAQYVKKRTEIHQTENGKIATFYFLWIELKNCEKYIRWIDLCFHMVHSLLCFCAWARAHQCESNNVKSNLMDNITQFFHLKVFTFVSTIPNSFIWIWVCSMCYDQQNVIISPTVQIKYAETRRRRDK